MMDDLQARLDRAITEAREQVTYLATRHYERMMANDDLRPVLDRYAALVALRARISEQGYGNMLYGRMAELDAEAERLLGEDA